MKIIPFIVQKEFLQIFRNKSMLPIIFVMPFVQLLVLSYAANFEVKNLTLYITDHDYSAASQRLVNKFQGTGYFQLTGLSSGVQAGFEQIEKNEADLILQIPFDFEKNLYSRQPTDLQLIVNAIDGIKAGLANTYSNAIIADFNEEISAELPVTQVMRRAVPIQIESHNWFNTELDYKTFMVPGILVLLVTMIGAFLSSMNIVREKEIGTIEQLNATTIKKHQFIIGKLLPFWLLGLAELTFGLILARLIFDIPFEGSLLLVFGFAAIYMLVVLGIGMFISTVTDTQQQAMFIAWFFLVIFILMSGLFTAIENMPIWAQQITRFNPVAYFVKFMRMVLLKGSTFQDVQYLFGAITLYAIIINVLAILNYRKTSI